MYLQFIIVLIVKAKIILGQSKGSTSNPINFTICKNAKTITGQITTNVNDPKSSCQCQVLPPKDPTTNNDYVFVPGVGSYKLHTVAANWNDARKICNEENAHLAIINSRAEEAALVNMLKRAENSIVGGLNKEEALLGIHDLYNEGEWVTIFGESLYSTGYSNWSPTYWKGQPDNYGGNQNCGAILNQGGMDDVNCNDKFAFFCELPLNC